jgi:hypothetical protein
MEAHMLRKPSFPQQIPAGTQELREAGLEFFWALENEATKRDLAVELIIARLRPYQLHIAITALATGQETYVRISSAPPPRPRIPQIEVGLDAQHGDLNFPVPSEDWLSAAKMVLSLAEMRMSNQFNLVSAKPAGQC